MTEEDRRRLTRHNELVELIKPIFSGVDPQITGTVLAELVALLIAGHIGPKSESLDKMREELLQIHIKGVRRLIELADAELRKRGDVKQILTKMVH